MDQIILSVISTELSNVDFCQYFLCLLPRKCSTLKLKILINLETKIGIGWVLQTCSNVSSLYGIIYQI